MSIFKDLSTSMQQAIEIAEGKSEAARITRYEVADVKAIRSQLHVTQKELASALDVSVDTVKSWEQKRRNPTGLAEKVLCVLRDEPELFNKFAAV
ncbi:transcriptional regulator [Vibrio navarrensis]|uniref:Helix-turn-helix domain-containing protein n=1 Tax=Vibrio navarrensis TaxID=29495 RepID=A0AAJ4IHK9_9VIBR|nr:MULTISPECIES: NadS family protein [Vibrio]KJR29108.1 transcriptional regulator [Vibrio sp. S234-5]MBE3653877.1 transcriptional regulator [Vibrio navarrensis]MBE3662712.1 transcriptional regulator [Vibrio navarrensis]QPL56614.1 helix-turn-helix domain-containing protein [Vibrio navarrensis]